MRMARRGRCSAGHARGGRWGDGREGWRFVTVQRPSGVKVLFALNGPLAGHPVNVSNLYRLELVGKEFDLKFAREPVAAPLRHQRELAPGARLAGAPGDLRGQGRRRLAVHADLARRLGPGHARAQSGADRRPSCDAARSTPWHTKPVRGRRSEAWQILPGSSRIFQERDAAGAVVRRPASSLRRSRPKYGAA